MKIIIVNYRYFISGGPERYLFNIKEIFEQHGHTVIPFSVKHNKNLETEYEEYFMKPIGKGDEVFANEYEKTSPKTVFTVLGRMWYSFEAKNKLKRLINKVKPDLVYVLHFQNKMSASVIDAAYGMNVPVVQRISDFGHICVNNSFFINQKNEVCERCLHGSRINAIRFRCVHNSYFESLAKVIALKIQDLRKTVRKISAFVIPADFTSKKFIEFGVPQHKIHCIPTFYNGADKEMKEIGYGDYFLYVGRVDREKGMMTMIKAFENTSYKLIIIGSSKDGYDEYLKSYLADKKHHISFLGKLDFNDIKPYLQTCLCTLCPSLCYDNLPNSVLESYAYEKGVIASRLGPLIDQIEDNGTGLHFEAGNHLDLQAKARFIFENREKALCFGKKGKEKLLAEYSETFHYQKLIQLFDTLIISKN
ncbi:MAG: glycosyltransferase family 4 protein [Bacteroidia bacterium]|nr:glycosyltransferase family 4 protein [Bacteroidia bacterium]